MRKEANMFFRYLSLFLVTFLCVNVTNAQFTDPQKSNLHIVNEWNNGGAEYGKVNWSETGSGTLSTDTSTKLRGKASIKFVSAGSGDYVSSSAVSCKQGPNCLVRFWYKSTSANFTATIYDGSSNLIQTLALPANTEFTKSELSFIAATPTTTYSLRVTDGNAGADTIYIDEGYLGTNDNIGSVNLADKQYDLTVTATNWTTTRAVGIPYKTREGAWRLRFNISGTLSITGVPTITISGISFKTGLYQVATVQSGAATGTNAYINPATGQVQANGSNHTAWYFAGDAELDSIPTWTVGYASEQVVRAEGTGFLFGALEWQNVANCAFTGQNAVLTDTDCNNATSVYGQAENGAADNLEIKTSNLNANDIYKVTMYGTGRIDSAGTSLQAIAAIYDGTTTKPCLIAQTDSTNPGYSSGFTCVAYFSYTSIQTTKTFQVKEINNATPLNVYAFSTALLAGVSVENVSRKVSMPQIINSVGTKYDGQTVLNSVRIAGASDFTACTSSPCTTYAETGDWVSSVTRSSQGRYVVNFNSGIFNGTPTCTCSAGMITGSVYPHCEFSAISSTSYTLFVTDNAGTTHDEAMNLICHGIK
jgi:hypothetical protein